MKKEKSVKRQLKSIDDCISDFKETLSIAKEVFPDVDLNNYFSILSKLEMKRSLIADKIGRK